jgi:hypothetical protein
MELKFISIDAYHHLINKIDGIAVAVTQKTAESPLDEVWLDIQEACSLLKVSKRTLQSYRNNKILPFSQIAGKIYFKASDIQLHLEKNYHK